MPPTSTPLSDGVRDGILVARAAHLLERMRAHAERSRAQSPAPTAAQITRVGATISMLRRLQEARAAGHRGYLATDPAWLVDMAINRRAGWVEDPHAHGAVNARKLPRLATSNAQRHLTQIAARVNTPRLIVRRSELGELQGYLMKHIPDRFHRPEDD